MRFFESKTNIDFMGVRKWAILGSVLVILMGIISLVVKGGPRYGVDFAGGTLVQIKFQDPVDINRIRDILKNLDIGEVSIQQYGEEDSNEVLLRMTQTTSSLEGFEEIIKDALAKDMGAAAFDIRRVEMVGPKVGKDLREKGIWAIIFASLGILIYVWWRFEFVYSLGAIMALVHDVLVTIGAFSLTNREFTLPVIAALLTIIGYSINDTIVVFDRVRDNNKILRGKPLEEILNTSINETLSRTILTSLTTFFVVFCLFVMGGPVINDFAFALIIGVIVGTYSSIYIASPVALFLHKFALSARPVGSRTSTKKEITRARIASTAEKGGVSRMMAQQKQGKSKSISKPGGGMQGQKKASKGAAKKRDKKENGSPNND
ncbi:protein translocase subunit SecF [bacterium]|nr:protein translocase subunit SecF [bacterium]